MRCSSPVNRTSRIYPTLRDSPKIYGSTARMCLRAEIDSHGLWGCDGVTATQHESLSVITAKRATAALRRVWRERSEGSLSIGAEMLRCAQHDSDSVITACENPGSCQRTLPIVTVDARLKHAGMTQIAIRRRRASRF